MSQRFRSLRKAREAQIDRIPNRAVRAAAWAEYRQFPRNAFDVDGSQAVHRARRLAASRSSSLETTPEARQ